MYAKVRTQISLELIQNIVNIILILIRNKFQIPINNDRYGTSNNDRNDRLNNFYNNGNPYSADRNPYSGDRNSFYDQNNPNRNPYGNNFNNYNNPYENNYQNQYDIENERRIRIETEKLRQLLTEIETKNSAECSLNVAAQWNFETNVNEVTQIEAVSSTLIVPKRTSGIDLQHSFSVSNHRNLFRGFPLVRCGKF